MSGIEQLLADNAACKFSGKTVAARRLIVEALEILSGFGVPLADLTPRHQVMMAQCFLAVADVRPRSGWAKAKCFSDGRSLKSRDIINYINEHFGEDVSSGSYDDIRRKHLLLPVTAGIIVPTVPGAARNAPNRGYAVSDEHAAVVRQFGKPGWPRALREFMKGRLTLSEMLAQKRRLVAMEVTLPSGAKLEFGPGEHNQLQKAIIEEFLPRYGFEADVLYVGDADKKQLLVEADKLKALSFFELSHGELPDVVAFSRRKNWLYLIEAVHSANPISPLRLAKLKTLTKDCPCGIVYVTAFLDREAFRRFMAEIAWETEVWIAAEPDHVIHFNGEKFLGPYQANPQG